MKTRNLATKRGVTAPTTKSSSKRSKRIATTAPPLASTAAPATKPAPVSTVIAAAAAAEPAPAVVSPTAAKTFEDYLQDLEVTASNLKLANKDFCDITKHTPEHARKCTKFLHALIDVIQSKKFDGVIEESLRELVYVEELGFEVPRYFVVLGGDVTSTKCRVLGDVLFEWMR